MKGIAIYFMFLYLSHFKLLVATVPGGYQITAHNMGYKPCVLTLILAAVIL